MEFPMKLLQTATFAMIAALFTLPATAQEAKPKVGDRIGDWTFQCQAVAADQNICGLVQVIADNNTRRQILSVAVRTVGKEKRLALLVTAPLGIFLGAGIGGKIDEGEQFKFNLQSCTQRGCQGGLELKGKQLAELKKGNRLLIGFKGRPDSNTVTVPVSLKGFTAGLKAIGAK